MRIAALTLGLGIFAVSASGFAGAKMYQMDTSTSKINWEGKKIAYGHKGYVKLKQAAFQVEAGKQVMGSVIIDMTSITCTDLSGDKKGKLEAHLKDDDFFAVNKYKTASYHISRSEVIGKDKYRLFGEMTIRGQTNQEVFEVVVKEKGGKLDVTGDLVVDRTKYGVEYNSSNILKLAADKVINDNIELQLMLRGNASGETN